MKISKLFHWLYALVMLLPIFAIGVTCGYAMFNKNAYQSYNEKITNLSLVTTQNMQIENSNYKISLKNGNLYSETIYINSSTIDYSYLFNTEINFNVIAIRFYPENTHFRIYDEFNESYNTELNEEKRQYLNNQTFNYKSGNLVGSTNYPVQFYLLVSTNGSIDNVFYYSIDKVKQSSLFNWAYDSFLVTPFSYIVNLFSMPTNSFIVMLLSYWLAISIIWLVFDLVMYVPLLVHRWIDKGVLE